MCVKSSHPWVIHKTSLSNDSTVTDVRATGLLSLSPVIWGFFGMGMMVERLKHEGTSQWSVEDLCEDGGFHKFSDRLLSHCLGLMPSISCYFFLKTWRTSSCRCGGDGGCRRCEWCFYKPAIKLVQIVYQLSILHCAGDVSCNWVCLSDLFTLKPCH